MNRLQHYRKIIWAGTTTICAAGLLMAGLALADGKRGGEGQGPRARLDEDSLKVTFEKSRRGASVKAWGMFECPPFGGGSEHDPGGHKKGSEGRGPSCDLKGIEVKVDVKFEEEIRCVPQARKGHHSKEEESTKRIPLMEWASGRTDAEGVFEVKVPLWSSGQKISCRSRSESTLVPKSATIKREGKEIARCEFPEHVSGVHKIEAWCEVVRPGKR